MTAAAAAGEGRTAVLGKGRPSRLLRKECNGENSSIEHNSHTRRGFGVTKYQLVGGGCL